MEPQSLREEKLRQASCEGNEDAVKFLLASGVNVNSANAMNGWTALHWAAKRGHVGICKSLCEAGAQKNALNHKQETPADLASNAQVLEFLDCKDKLTALSAVCGNTKSNKSFVPNYLANPVFVHSQPLEPGQKEPVLQTSSGSNSHDSGALQPPSLNWFWYQPSSTTLIGASTFSPCGLAIHPDHLVLKVRTASDDDFSEMAIDRKAKIRLQDFKKILSNHLGKVELCEIALIRKLPNTIICTDEDIRRLTDYQEVEVVLTESKAIT